MKWIVLAVVTGATWIAVPNFYTALQRSYQKRTMADMRTMAAQFEEGKPLAPARDAWGHPMRLRVDGKHYSIRAAGRDGKFEQDVPFRLRMIDSYDGDLLLVNGEFWQMPEGL